MSNDSNGEPNINPYAPPLYELNPPPVKTLHSKDRPSFEQLLNQLAQAPILATAHVWQFEFPANAVPSEKQPQNRNVRLAIVAAQLLWLVSLVIPQTRVLGMLTFVFLALFSVFAYSDWTTPKSEFFVSPAGIYSWLITEGGILVTTPSGGQWGIPWSRIHSITAIKGGWNLQTLSSQPHAWQMLLEGIEVDDSPLFLEVAYLFPDFAAFRSSSPNPLCETDCSGMNLEPPFTVPVGPSCTMTIKSVAISVASSFICQVLNSTCLTNRWYSRICILVGQPIWIVSDLG